MFLFLWYYSVFMVPIPIAGKKEVSNDWLTSLNWNPGTPFSDDKTLNFWIPKTLLSLKPWNISEYLFFFLGNISEYLNPFSSYSTCLLPYSIQTVHDVCRVPGRARPRVLSPIAWFAAAATPAHSAWCSLSKALLDCLWAVRPYLKSKF